MISTTQYLPLVFIACSSIFGVGMPLTTLSRTKVILTSVTVNFMLTSFSGTVVAGCYLNALGA